MLAGQSRRKLLTYLAQHSLFSSPEYFLQILMKF